MTIRSFASDNGAGVHPKVLQAIAAANVGHAPAYGADAWSARAEEALRAAFGNAPGVFFTFGGTGANVVALGALAERWDAVLCADCAHIFESECAAPEHYFGGKLIPVPTRDGLITIDALRPLLGPTRGVHHARPRVLSLTQPTEWGTLYSAAELAALCTFAHERGLRVHMDGARYANACAAFDVPLNALAGAVGVDVLAFGGTKNGLLGAEAVIVFDPVLAERAAYARKQATQLASKMRFVAAQFSAYLENDLWRELAAHANAMAARLAAALHDTDGIEFVVPVECNMLFPRLPRAAIESLQADFPFYVWREGDDVVRWITSFDTTPDDIDTFAHAVRRTLAR